MSEKFKTKFRIPSTRLINWDYRRNASYFVTICTHNRGHYFGRISRGIMYLSEIGLFADKYWKEIPDHISGIELGAFVVMPNHVHGIVVINDAVETLHATSLQNTHHKKSYPPRPPKSGIVDIKMSDKSPKKGSLSSIIRSYKSAVTKDAHHILKDFGWQERFYDHIIRDNASYLRIKNYINNNPQNWCDDKFHT